MTLRKRSIQIAGHATSLALEPEFWAVLERMAVARRSSLAALIVTLDGARGSDPLASAARTTALAWATENGGPEPGDVAPGSGPSAAQLRAGSRRS